MNLETNVFTTAKFYNMTKEQEKLNTRYYKLLAEHKKLNERALACKKEMASIRLKIVPRQPIVEERPDELELKH